MFSTGGRAQTLPGGIMLGFASSPIEQRIRKLQNHLEQENPILLQIVKSFRLLDGVAYRTGMLDNTQSFATRVPWWPLVAVLGTFSSGKSSFINSYLGVKLQQTGNQAVDDKFTVVCFTNDEVSRTLPGLALDADPRFPFYQMSKSLEQVAAALVVGALEVVGRLAVEHEAVVTDLGVDVEVGQRRVRIDTERPDLEHATGGVVDRQGAESSRARIVAGAAHPGARIGISRSAYRDDGDTHRPSHCARRRRVGVARVRRQRRRRR